MAPGRMSSWPVRPFAPLAASVRGYNWRCFRGDLLAGLTVAVLEIPQAMAYALIAGVPAQYGIYTSIVQGFIGALFASNNHLASGPTNTHALLIAATLTRLADPGDVQTYVQLAFALCVVKGLIQIAFAAARLGDLIRYVSTSVIIGFTGGAGVLIAVGQVPGLLGMPVASGAATWPGVLGAVEQLIPHLGQFNTAALAVAGGCLVLMVVLRRINRLLPGPLIAVAAAALVVRCLGWESADLPLVGAIPHASLLWPQVPRLSPQVMEVLLPGALALALLGMIETVAIGKTLMTQSGHRVHANQEFFAQGIANLIGGFFQNFPGTGSFIRSALNAEAGGKTRFAGMFNSVFVLLLFTCFRDQVRFVPQASLAAVLIIIAFNLIDVKAILRIYRGDRTDFVVCLTSLVSTLVIPLHYAIYLGVILNLALYLRRASQLHMQEMVRTDAGPFIERPITDRQGQKQVMFLQIEGDLFFAQADELQDRLTDIAQSRVRVVIFRLKRTLSIDTTVMTVLDQFIRRMQHRGGHVLLCGVRDDLMVPLDRFGLLGLIGKANVFPTGYGVFTSAKQALRRARELVGSSLDTAHIDADDEPESWAYEI